MLEFVAGGLLAVGGALAIQATSMAREAKHHTPDPEASRRLGKAAWLRGGGGILLILAGVAVFALAGD